MQRWVPLQENPGKAAVADLPLSFIPVLSSDGVQGSPSLPGCTAGAQGTREQEVEPASKQSRAKTAAKNPVDQSLQPPKLLSVSQVGILR